MALFCVSALAQNPARKDRVFVRDIEGIWINEEYVRTLTTMRSPHAAARQVPPVVIAVKPEGRTHPIVVTDFNKAAINAVLEVEPDAKPGFYRLVLGTDDRPVASSEVKYLYFQGTRNAQGKFDRLRFAEIFFMKGKWADYRLLTGEVNPFINRLVLAGSYRDDKGRPWEFTEAGAARWPDQKFNYELSLNDPGAGCEYLQTEGAMSGADKKRYGFAWKGGKLSIFPAKLADKKVRCETKAIAILTPQ
jgi:hypothetical protein